jgi:hypothetical protein
MPENKLKIKCFKGLRAFFSFMANPTIFTANKNLQGFADSRQSNPFYPPHRFNIAELLRFTGSHLRSIQERKSYRPV